MNFSLPYPHNLHWLTHKEKAGIQIQCAEVDGSPFKAVRGTMTVSATVVDCINLIKDGTRLHEWIDGCNFSAQHETLPKREVEPDSNKNAPTRFIAQLIYSVPWPLKDVISTELNTLTWASDSKSAQLHYQTLTPAHPSEKQHAKKCQSMLHTEGVWIVSYVNDNLSIITHTGYAKPGGKIPAPLVNSSALSGQEASFATLRKLLETQKS